MFELEKANKRLGKNQRFDGDVTMSQWRLRLNSFRLFSRYERWLRLKAADIQSPR
jgi:hypothetical protein